MRSNVVTLSAAVLFVVILFPALAEAADVAVNCNRGKSINAALATLNKKGPNRMLISGTCNEHVLIVDFDRLTLIGDRGAMINAPTQNAPVVSIQSSDYVELSKLTINGGNTGLTCGPYSTCTLRDVVEQGATGIGGHGLFISPGSNLNLVGNTIIQNNALNGVVLEDNSTLVADGSVTIRNNGEAGIGADQGSSVKLEGSNISGNAVGVSLRSSTLFVIGYDTGHPATITGNIREGVGVLGLSRARFQGAVNITGNGSLDVSCISTMVLTSGTDNLGGGTTNCVDGQ